MAKIKCHDCENTFEEEEHKTSLDSDGQFVCVCPYCEAEL